jgi:phosphatidylglycerol:prolipoprotein diacylglycerol transferase
VKNLALAAWLLHVRRTVTTPGAVAARFVFWYAAPRIAIDLLRDYPTHRVTLGTGQVLNIAMAGLGALLLVRSRLRRLGRLPPARGPVALQVDADVAPSPVQRLAFAALLAACLTMPSNWTQDVPRRYGERHAGLRHSWLYPQLDWAPPR